MTHRVKREGNVRAVLCALAFAWSLALFAQVQVLPLQAPPAVLAGPARPVSIMLHNPTPRTCNITLVARLYQASSATSAPCYERTWKTLTVLPGQTVLETATLGFPAVRVETPFIVQWLDGTNTVLGTTMVRVFPTNLLAGLRALAGDKPLGLFDPSDQLESLLRALNVEFQDLAEEGTDKFSGRLALIGPFESKEQMRAGLAGDLRALAKRGVAVVWLQPPPPREPLKPSFHLVRERAGAIVVAQHALVERPAENPEAQLNLLRLAELAMKPVDFDLPQTETSN